MIVKIETEISGTFKIEKDMKVKHYPFDIDILFDEKKEKYVISISKKVYDYSSHLPKILAENQKIKKNNFTNQNFLKEQIQILQHIESFGAIDKGVERIDWQNCSIEWIPETEEEQKELSIREHSIKLYYDTQNINLSKDWLFNTIIYRRQLSDFTLPFTFFREGSNFFHNFQYQNSFLNFYWMLEGFFGNGIKYDNKTMKAEFKNSGILEYAINETVEYLKTCDGNHYEWLINTCKKYSKNCDKDGIIHILVEQRGNLSHFSLSKSKKQKNPYTDTDYESLAFISMTICRYSSIKLRLEPFRRKTLSR